MIAIVSSTLAPSTTPSHDGPRTTFSPEERLEQTKGTIASLVALGVKDIVVADNSANRAWPLDNAAALAPARVLHFSQPPIRNKGIGELWLLLGAVGELAENEPVLKISGRYRVGRATGLALREGDDIAAKTYRHGRVTEISTRCYLLGNRAIAARFWQRSLDELYADASRVVGPRSFLRILRNSVRRRDDHHSYSDPTVALEVVSHRAIRDLGLRLRSVEHLDVEGILGSWINPPVSE